VVDIQLSVARPPGCGDFLQELAIDGSLNIATRVAADPVSVFVAVVATAGATAGTLAGGLEPEAADA
jgi:hypothetical protein